MEISRKIFFLIVLLAQLLLIFEAYSQKALKLSKFKNNNNNKFIIIL